MRLPSLKQAFPELKDDGSTLDSLLAEVDSSSSTSFLLPPAAVENQMKLSSLEPAFPDELIKDGEESNLDSPSAEANSSSSAASRKSKKNKSKKKKAKQKRRQEQEQKQRQEETPSERQRQTQTQKEGEEQEYDGPAVWTRLLANHIAPFLADRSDWNSAMASCKALALFSQGKQQRKGSNLNLKLSTSKLPPFPSKLSLPTGVVGHPTSVALSSNRRWLIVGTSSGQVQCCHVLHGWTSIPNDSNNNKGHSQTFYPGAADETTQKMLRDIQAAGSIRHLAFTTSACGNGEPVLVVGQKYKVTLWKLSDTGQKAVWIPFNDLTMTLSQGQELLTMSASAEGSILAGYLCLNVDACRSIRFVWQVPDPNNQGEYLCVEHAAGNCFKFTDGAPLGFLRAPGHVPSIVLDMGPGKLDEQAPDHGKFAFTRLPNKDGSPLISSCHGMGIDGKVKTAILTQGIIDSPPCIMYGDLHNVLATEGVGTDRDDEFGHLPVDCYQQIVQMSTPVTFKQACLAFNHNSTVLAVGYAKTSSSKVDTGGVIHVYDLKTPNIPVYKDLHPPSRDELFGEVLGFVAPFIEKRSDYNNAIVANKVVLSKTLSHHKVVPWPERIAIQDCTVTALTFTADGEWIVVGTSTGEVRLINSIMGPLPKVPLEAFGKQDLVAQIRDAGPIVDLALMEHRKADDPKDVLWYLIASQGNLQTVWHFFQCKDKQTGQTVLPIFIPFDSFREEAIFEKALGTPCRTLAAYSTLSRYVSCQVFDSSMAEGHNSLVMLRDKDLEKDSKSKVVPLLLPGCRHIEDLEPMAILPVQIAVSEEDQLETSLRDVWFVFAQSQTNQEDEEASESSTDATRLSSICAAVTPGGQILVATLDRDGVLEYRSGSTVQDMIVSTTQPRADTQMLREILGEQGGVKAEVDVVAPPGDAPTCLSFNHDASLLAAGVNNEAENSATIAIWNLDHLQFGMHMNMV